MTDVFRKNIYIIRESEGQTSPIRYGQGKICSETFMRTVIRYYKDLWLQKSGAKPYKVAAEPLLGRALHYLFDPTRNGRHVVARRLLTGISGKLLDIGCWGGEALASMGMLQQFGEVFAVDLIEESVEKARVHGVNSVLCDLNEGGLPFSDNIFDAVTCLAVIGAIFDPYLVLSEIYRVLKTHGVLILNVPNVGSLPNRVRLLLGRLPVTSRDPGWDGGQLHYFTLFDTKKALESKGFRVLKVQVSGGTQALRQLWPSLLSGTLTFKAVKE